MNDSASNGTRSQQTDGPAFDVDMERQAKDNTVVLAIEEDSNRPYQRLLIWLGRPKFNSVRIAQPHLFCSMVQTALLTSIYVYRKNL